MHKVRQQVWCTSWPLVKAVPLNMQARWSAAVTRLKRILRAWSFFDNMKSSFNRWTVTGPALPVVDSTLRSTLEGSYLDIVLIVPLALCRRATQSANGQTWSQQSSTGARALNLWDAHYLAGGKKAWRCCLGYAGFSKGVVRSCSWRSYNISINL